MVTLKIVLVALLCAPLLYVAVQLISKLLDEALKSNHEKAERKNKA